MEYYYFLEKNGTKLGPFKLGELKSLTIHHDDLVWRSDSTHWRKASDFNELEGVYFIKPPLTPMEYKISEMNEKFSSQIIGYLVKAYIIASILIGYISFELAQSSWEGKGFGRYPRYYPEMDNEIMYANSEKFLFRPFRAFYSTVYLTKDEQENSVTFFLNLTLSSFATLSFIFVIMGIVYYLIQRVNINVEDDQKVTSAVRTPRQQTSFSIISIPQESPKVKRTIKEETGKNYMLIPYIISAILLFLIIFGVLEIFKRV